MKTTALLLFALLYAAVTLHADSPEFDRLQSGYKEAVERVTKPLTQTYLRELERLRDNYTRASNLSGATRVQAEIDVVGKALAFAEVSKKAPTVQAPPVPAPAPTAKEAASANKLPELRWFVAKTWLTDALTEWSFEKDGKGKKVRGNQTIAIFTWRVLESGVVELSEQAAPGKPASITYLRFNDRNEAWFGGDIGKLNARLHHP
jgi:hypothetical protein